MGDGVIEYSEAVRAKARKLLDDPDRVRADVEHANIWYVQASDGVSYYRVQCDYDSAFRTLSWITCTCPHGLKVGAGETACYHAAAVLILLQEADPEVHERHLVAVPDIPDAQRAVSLIAEAMSGKEWSPDTLDEVADIVRNVGGEEIRDVDQ
jgi:hypothetical protein